MFLFGSQKFSNELILASRILLSLLLIIFGWEKLIDFNGTIGFMAQIGVPAPELSALIAIAAEFFGGLAIILGILTRPLSILLIIYVFATALIGHHYWTMSGMARFENEINFFKNISIMGGFLLLYITGPGKFSIDAKIGLA